MNYALLHVFSGTNRGDAGIVLAIQRAIEAHDHEARFTFVPTIHPGDTQYARHVKFFQDLGMQAVANPFPSPDPAHPLPRRAVGQARAFLDSRWLLRGRPASRGSGCRPIVGAFERSDAVVVKGGASLYCPPGLRGLLVCQRFLFPIRLACASGRPVFVFGQTVGPIAGPRGRNLMRAALGGVTRIYVREEISFGLLRELGLADRAQIIPDPCFYLYEPARFAKRRRDGGPVQLGVTVRSLGTGSRQEQYEDAVAQGIERFCRARPTEVTFIPQVTTPRPGEDDIPPARRLAARSYDAAAVRVLDELPFDELLETYSRMDCLLATRLHSAILAMICGTPAAVIDYQGIKGEGVMRMLGLERFLVKWPPLDPAHLERALEGVLAERESIRLTLGRVLPELRARVAVTAGEIVAAARVERDRRGSGVGAPV